MGGQKGTSGSIQENCFDVNKWYKHEPEKVVEKDLCNILWDFTIQTDHFIEARRHGT